MVIVNSCDNGNEYNTCVLKLLIGERGYVANF